MAQAASQNEPVTLKALEFITAMFGASTSCPVFFQTLANDKGDPDEAPIKRQLLTREGDRLLSFIAKHDRNRRGMFFCTSTLAEGSATRNKETVRETPGLFNDLDYKDIVEDVPTIYGLLERLGCPPTIRVRSGGGLHSYWLFKEGIDTQANLERLEDALRRLAEVTGGDPSVCEVSRLMRLPGTHNSKYGDVREVVCEFLNGPRYELDDLEAWLAEATPILTRKPPGAKAVQGPARVSEPEPVNPFMAFGKKWGFRPAIDVEAMLAAMAPGNVHVTQRDVSASLIKAGHDPDEVVELLMEATREAVGAIGAKWKWHIEEKKIRDLTASALVKYPPKVPRESATPKEFGKIPEQNQQNVVSHETLSDGSGAEDSSATGSENQADLSTGAGSGNAAPAAPDGSSGAGPDNVVGIQDGAKARLKRKPKPTALHIILADAVLAVMDQRGQQVMFTEVGDYHYQDGLWRVVEGDKALTAWLNSNIEEAARGLKIESTMKLVGEARAYILRSPELQRRQVPFNRHGMVPTRSGLIHPVTGEVIPPEPEHFTTWRIEHAFNPQAACPWWLQMLEDAFADRTPESRAMHVQLLQEILGLGLIDAKDKALSRALIFVGGSNYGKSGLIKVMAGLFGRRVNATSLDTLSGDNPHKTISFVKREPWVLHEAFDSGKWHLSSIVKAIISGEPIPINMKGGKMFDAEFTAPIFWGSNSPPQFREATDAIVNRIVVIDCRRKFDEDNPVGAAVEARARGYSKPSALVLATEAEGILAWAIEGLRRVLARGVFVLPTESRAAAEQVRLNSNMVAEFIQECVTFNPNGMVSVPDFVASHTSWWSEHKSDNRGGAPASEKIGLAIRALADERIAADAKELRSNARRYYAGISLNAEGKRHWRNTVTSSAFVYQSKTASTSAADENPNQPIPSIWDSKSSILAMRVAHEKSVTGSGKSNRHGSHEKGDRHASEKTVTDAVTEPDTEGQRIDISKDPLF